MASSALLLRLGEPVRVADARGDTELIARARAQDRLALHALYARHSPAIARFLRDVLGDPASAADATQETFVRAFRRIPTLRDDTRLLPWLFGIARHVAMESRKSRRREVDVAGDVRIERFTPESLLLGAEAARVLNRALRRLSDDRRAVLLLRVDHHLAYEEIADLMGWSLAKVKIEIHRGREALRAELEAWEQG